ncbi:uncharacterized protein LOC129339511 [Eublepharis macularius]|uniref:Uncharacterized protein LOC129339511 n=1 Tax=Eublepharis macularius TaxID=481883 RepID=A0AA97LCN9_EUBMA|nr:uncharacterized protein LOC129339511 [Eublepharis macularius]
MATYLCYLGKVTIVTGGTSGIGLAIVREFVRQGAKVVFCSLASEAKKGQAIQRELQDSGCPGEAYFQVCDVRQETDIKRLILVTIERYGCLDCLVNNVADYYSTKIDDVSSKDFCSLMDLNVVSCLLASKYSLPYLRETRGNIINIASIASVIGAKNVVSYCASKGAVIAMTKALAIDESKYGVRVNCISPACIWTPLLRSVISLSPDRQAAIQERKDHQLLGRFGTPEEVALGVLYLAADGTFCTGFNLILSGGTEVSFGKKSEVDPQRGPSVSGSSQDSSQKQQEMFGPGEAQGERHSTGLVATHIIPAGMEIKTSEIILTGGLDNMGGGGLSWIPFMALEVSKYKENTKLMVVDTGRRVSGKDKIMVKRGIPIFCFKHYQRNNAAERGQAIQRELKDSGCPGDAYFQVCDVRKETDIKRLILVTIEHYGCLDCLVNAVGVSYPAKIGDVSAQDFRNLMRTNVESCLLGSKYSLPYLRETRGNIINIASIAGVIGAKNVVSYCTSKGAVIAMTKALAIDESKYGVRVNCVSPAAIWTPFLKKFINQSPDPEATIQETKGHQLLGRFGTPEEVALGVLYLAADGTFCTGFDLMLSGGAEVGFGKKDEVDPEPGPHGSGSFQDSSRKEKVEAKTPQDSLDSSKLGDQIKMKKLRQTTSMATYLRYPDKVAIVTGGTSGIGLAVVREFVRQGAKVVFCSRASGAERGQAIQRELQDSGCPGEAFYQACDVRNETDIKRLILITVERYGCLDCLVNNVGDGYFEAIDDVSAQDFCNIMEINVVSGLLASKHALPYLRKTRGNIINIASLIGVLGVKHGVSYVSSKGAVIAMTKALAVDESKYGVRVNSVSPGNVWTPLWEKYASELSDGEGRIQEGKYNQLLGRFGTLEEVALGVLYLAADGTFCTGFNLIIGGGAEVGFGKKDEVDPNAGPRTKGCAPNSSRK